MSSANEIQVGGSHYKGGAIQHWDFVICTGADYLQGYSSKYIMRWRKMPKEKGLEDLTKSAHIVSKMHELATTNGNISCGIAALNRYINYATITGEMIGDFCKANDIAAYLDREILSLIFRWSQPVDLKLAAQRIHELIERHK